MGQVNTRITEVTVYPDRARIVRQGRVTVEAGVDTLQVTGLPARIDPESLRATARGSARARLLGVAGQRAYQVQAQQEQVRELEGQMEAAQDELRLVEANIEQTTRSRNQLSELAGQTQIFATALAAGEMTLEAHRALEADLRARLSELNGGLQQLAVQKRELERRLQKLKNELDQYRGQPRRESYTAGVEVEVLEPGELEIDLTYVITGCGWQPLYDLRLVEENGQPPVLEAGYLAQVVQRTGEAWEGVRLTLSTARPALAGRLPELNPWYVAPFLPPPPPPAVDAMPAPHAKRSMDPARMEMAAARPVMEVEAEVVTATVDTSGAAVTYGVAGRVDIPEDGAPHKVTIAQIKLEPRLDYSSAPKLVEAVYRRAKVVNDSPYTWLPGQANLFAGDEFIGSTRLEMVAPNGELELYLGVDDRVKVERELKRRDVDKRLIGSRRRLHFGYEIRLENLLPVPVKVSLQDQIPVARHEDIKVRLEGADPRPDEQTELNLLKWELSLAAKEKRTVRFDFSVEYPQSMELAGIA